jgi:hypothetical protein
MPGLGTNLPGSNTPGPTPPGTGEIPGTMGGQIASYPFGTGSPFGGISGASGSLRDAISDNLPEAPGGASGYTILPFPQARGQSDLSLQPFPNVPAGGQTPITLAPTPFPGQLPIGSINPRGSPDEAYIPSQPPRLGPFPPRGLEPPTTSPGIDPRQEITLDGLRNSPDVAAWLAAILASGRLVTVAEINALLIFMRELEPSVENPFVLPGFPGRLTFPSIYVRFLQVVLRRNAALYQLLTPYFQSLINLLGSPNYNVRARAMRLLRQFAPFIIALLQANSQNPDLEIARRVNRILSELIGQLPPDLRPGLFPPPPVGDFPIGPPRG